MLSLYLRVLTCILIGSKRGGARVFPENSVAPSLLYRHFLAYGLEGGWVDNKVKEEHQGGEKEK